MAKNKGKPKVPQLSSTGRIAAPLQRPEPSPQQQRPHFSLEYINNDNFRSCEKDERAALADTLYKLSQMSWAEIDASGRHQSGGETIDRSALKFPIPSHITEDVNIRALRFSGKKPMLGYRDRRVFYILWLDRDYTAYPHS